MIFRIEGEDRIEYCVHYLPIPPISDKAWKFIEEAQMSVQSARAAWQKSNGDAEGSKPEGHGTIRPAVAIHYGSESQKKSYGAVASTPSMGGTNPAGKDSSNCDDALGTPSKHRGSQGEVKVESGRGPAAAKKQLGRNWMEGTPAPDLK